MISALYTTFLVLHIYMFVFFLIAFKLKKNGVADLAWGGGFLIVAYLNFLFHGNFSLIPIISTLIITAWGMRLMLHILPRILSGKEDSRYAAMRNNWGHRAGLKSYTHVFLLQGILLFLIAYPVVMINQFPRNKLLFTDILGIGIWITG